MHVHLEVSTKAIRLVVTAKEPTIPNLIIILNQLLPYFLLTEVPMMSRLHGQKREKCYPLIHKILQPAIYNMHIYSV